MKKNITVSRSQSAAEDKRGEACRQGDAAEGQARRQTDGGNRAGGPQQPLLRAG